MVKYAFKLLISLYQKVISPFTPPSCRFIPSCSCYGQEALRQHSVGKAIFLILKRLLKCHPFSGQGFCHDPVPPSSRKTKTASHK